ncbi:MAG: amidohydrolase family protein [Pseudomonadales bacterium]|nr:amidohydrolase family protein [Pseudomonadales bacterium]
MTYAGNREIRDADSHLMELPDFLTRNVESSMRAWIPSLDDIRLADVGTQMRELEGSQGHTQETVEQLIALGDQLTRGPKWHAALGAFNGMERGMALDLLGFQQQVVFSSFCATKIFGSTDDRVMYAAAAAHNRSMAEFCACDSRLIGVGMAPLDDPTRADTLFDEALELGLGAIWIPSRAPGGRSPGHPDHDAFWRKLEETGVPFIQHVGSSNLSIPDPWMNDGIEERQTARGGAEVIGSKDLTVIFQAAQRFISVLVLDGVLERFPRLKGGVIELGAGWVPDTIRRLDHAVEIWARSEPHLAQFERKPSEQFHDQLRFTPYPFEDVGQLMSESCPELYLFSSDYPHAEGGRDPIKRFDTALVQRSAYDRSRFYEANFRDLYAVAE